MSINIKDSKRILLAKARSKYLSSALARQLVKIENSPLHKAYTMTFGCCSDIEVKDNEFKSLFYCRNRWCMNCQRIKMSTIISKYKPQLDALDDLHFVTLTAPTVTAENLPQRISDFARSWRKISDQARKYRQGFAGVRKAECKAKYTAGQWKYHYHFHIIIQGRANAEYLIHQWLRLNTDASPMAQDMRAVTNLESGVLEIFKYFTKLTTSDDAGNEHATPAKQLDIIFRALHRKRVYQPFGGLRQVDEEAMEIEKQEIIATPDIYEWYGQDWYSVHYGHALSGYEPDIEDGKLWRNDLKPRI